MPRGERRTAWWALVGWIALVSVGFLAQRWLGPPPWDADPELTQESIQLEHRIGVLREQIALVQALGNATPLFKALPAEMGFRDLDPHRRGARLNVGRADGVRPDQAVVSMAGLVGRVDRVEEHHSWVMLADDVEFRVLFQIHGRDATGVARGGAGVRRLQSIFRESSTRVRPGELAVTAGGDSVFPTGLLIGKVIDTDASGLRLRIEMPHDPAMVRAVAVLTTPGAP